jgi:hypothetical protein
MLTYRNHTLNRTHTYTGMSTPSEALNVLIEDENLAWKESMHNAGIRDLSIFKVGPDSWTLTIVAVYENCEQLYTGMVTT